MILILGAGISGISAGYHLGLRGLKATIAEKNDSWGGLCDNFKVANFRFDHAIHLSFTKHEYVKELFAKSCDYYTHVPMIGNYYKGYWLKHPAQNNLYPLSVDEKVSIIGDVIKRENKKSRINIQDYDHWLRHQYGNYFAENFPIRYTKKYWTIDAKAMSTDWIEDRMYMPTIEEVLRGAMTGDTPNTYYAKEMRYPITGGYKSFLHYMADRCSIRLKKNALLIDLKNKKVEFEDGTFEYYENLVSSLPLPEIVKLIKDCPKAILLSSEKLLWSSVGLVSLGFNRPDVPKYLWFYIYDEDIVPARIYSPMLKSPDNVPYQCSSLQAEVYFSKHKPLPFSGDNLIKHVVDSLVKIGLFGVNDVMIADYRELKYGNVIFDKEIYENRSRIHNYLDSVGIKYIGRFGKWDYLWSDQGLLSGKDVNFD